MDNKARLMKFLSINIWEVLKGIETLIKLPCSKAKVSTMKKKIPGRWEKTNDSVIFKLNPKNYWT